MIGVELSHQLDVLEKHLHGLGYRDSDGTVIRNYEFIATEGRAVCADLLAFADARRWDISTACIVVQQWSNGHDKLAALRQLSYVGAPIALFALPDLVEIWAVRTDVEVARPKDRLSYEELEGYFQQRAGELSPRLLLNAKRGERQLSFFDIDPSLEDFARKATQETLVQQFERAYDSIPPEVGKSYPKAMTRLAIRILAARILQDKLTDHKDLQKRDVVSLLNAVQRSFPVYFTDLEDDLGLVGPEAVEALYDGLCGGFTFRSLTNDMLAYFYENTLVSSEEMRRQLGIYYTPRVITERILRRLPVEDLCPEERTVLDGTCGSGNLLLAAYDRLSGLLPAQWTPEECHSYLLDHIWGVDQDTFACEVARLSLLLYNLPIGDDWRIKQGNVFQVDPKQMFGDMPHIIVGNPPFREPRSTEGRRIQRAAQVMDRYLDWLAPEGLLGAVVPLTFLHNRSARETRKRLLETCDVLEVWHLPENSIPGSSAATAVILARKLSSVRSGAAGLLTRVEEVDDIARWRTNRHQSPTTSYVVSQERWFSHPEEWMVSSSFDHTWDRIESQFPEVEPQFCIIRNGIQVGKQARPTHLSSEEQGEGWERVLSRNKSGNTLEPFRINWASQEDKYVKYPSEELQWPRNPDHFRRPVKLVMNATRNVSNPWRFYAAIDLDQLIVTENFHYVLPSETVTIEELTAVFNSTVANAWYSSRNYQRDVNLTYFKRMPLPGFSEQQKKEIHSLVWRITELKQSLLDPRVEEIRRCIIRLDEIVFAAYGLSAEERKQIRGWMDRFPRPGQEWEGKPLVSDVSEESIPYQGRRWRLSGEIETIDIEHRTVSLWAQGRGSSMEIPIPSTMPGWALRPGAAFSASIPWEQRHETDLSRIKWLDFQPLEFGYLSDEELIALLTEEEGV